LQTVNETFALLSSQYGCFLTVSDVAKIMNVSRPVIDNLKNSGDLPFAKVGRQYRIKLDEFIKWWDHRVNQEQKKIIRGCL